MSIFTEQQYNVHAGLALEESTQSLTKKRNRANHQKIMAGIGAPDANTLRAWDITAQKALARIRLRELEADYI